MIFCCGRPDIKTSRHPDIQTNTFIIVNNCATIFRIWIGTYWDPCNQLFRILDLLGPFCNTTFSIWDLPRQVSQHVSWTRLPNKITLLRCRPNLSRHGNYQGFPSISECSYCSQWGKSQPPNYHLILFLQIPRYSRGSHWRTWQP